MKGFLLLSLLVHVAAAMLAFFLPPAEREKPKELKTTLVTPEELERAFPRPPMPSPVPKMPQSRKRETTKRPPPRDDGRTVPIPAPPIVRRTPAPERPVVPGDGSETGKPLPEDRRPVPGRVGPGDGTAGKEAPPATAPEKPGQTGKERLFDRGIIGETASRDATRRGKKDDTITFETQEYRYAGYMRKLKERIESIWEYPYEAREKGIYGDLKIRFTIRKDGRLESAELVRTSGYKLLDDAALKALKEGEPYWPLPDEWKMDSYTILGHFVYSLYGYYVR